MTAMSLLLLVLLLPNHQTYRVERDAMDGAGYVAQVRQRTDGDTGACTARIASSGGGRGEKLGAGRGERIG